MAAPGVLKVGSLGISRIGKGEDTSLIAHLSLHSELVRLEGIILQKISPNAPLASKLGREEHAEAIRHEEPVCAFRVEDVDDVI